jgi:hypothetical protein
VSRLVAGWGGLARKIGNFLPTSLAHDIVFQKSINPADFSVARDDGAIRKEATR